MLNPLDSIPTWFLLLLIVALSLAVAPLRRRFPTDDAGVLAAGAGTAIVTGLATWSEGFGPLWFVGTGMIFIQYVGIALVVIWGARRLLRLRNGTGSN